MFFVSPFIPSRHKVSWSPQQVGLCPIVRRLPQAILQDAPKNDAKQVPTSASSPPPSSTEGKKIEKDAPFDGFELPSGSVRARRQVRGGGRRLIGNVRTQGRRYVKLPPNPPGIRVAAGSAKGRRVSSPNVYLRPMMAKVREALFSMLNVFGVVRPDATVLDLFSGTGSIAIEALSRGMASAVLVDYAQECAEAAENNLTHCGFAERGKVVRARVEEFIPQGAMYNNGKHYDLITITPPYEEVDYKALLEALVQSDCIGEGTFVVVEYPVELKTFPSIIGHRLIGVRNRKYGRTMLAVYACHPDVDIDLRPDEFELQRRKR